jgi:5,10-methenyltetrahydrofolate synthetase
MKNKLRKEKLDMRQAMSEHSVQSGSEAITQRLLCLPCVREARRIMTYCATRNEPDMWDFTYALLDMGKQVALPCVTAEGIVAAEYKRGTQMYRGAYGIQQPVPAPQCAAFEPELVIVPGVVFDLQLCRIGFGVGYYDRFLLGSRAVKIGVCYENQLVDNIEAEPHDVRMDFVVTEDRVLGMA